MYCACVEPGPPNGFILSATVFVVPTIFYLFRDKWIRLLFQKVQKIEKKNTLAHHSSSFLFI